MFNVTYNSPTWKEKQSHYERTYSLSFIPEGGIAKQKGLKISEAMGGLTYNVELNRLDITELFERIEKLEKENQQMKQELERLKRQKNEGKQ